MNPIGFHELHPIIGDSKTVVFWANMPEHRPKAKVKNKFLIFINSHFLLKEIIKKVYLMILMVNRKIK